MRELNKWNIHKIFTISTNFFHNYVSYIIMERKI